MCYLALAVILPELIFDPKYLEGPCAKEPITCCQGVCYTPDKVVCRTPKKRITEDVDCCEEEVKLVNSNADNNDLSEENSIQAGAKNEPSIQKDLSNRSILVDTPKKKPQRLMTR